MMLDLFCKYLYQAGESYIMTCNFLEGRKLKRLQKIQPEVGPTERGRSSSSWVEGKGCLGSLLDSAHEVALQSVWKMNLEAWKRKISLTLLSQVKGLHRLRSPSNSHSNAVHILNV